MSDSTELVKNLPAAWARSWAVVTLLYLYSVFVYRLFVRPISLLVFGNSSAASSKALPPLTPYNSRGTEGKGSARVEEGVHKQPRVFAQQKHRPLAPGDAYRAQADDIKSCALKGLPGPRGASEYKSQTHAPDS